MEIGPDGRIAHEISPSRVEVQGTIDRHQRGAAAQRQQDDMIGRRDDAGRSAGGLDNGHCLVSQVLG